MARLIDAEALMEEVYDSDEKHGNDVWHTSDIEYLLMAQPTVDAVEVVHCEWQFGELDFLGAPVKCPNCGWGVKKVDPISWLEYPGHKFCGNCGASMRERSEGE